MTSSTQETEVLYSNRERGFQSSEGALLTVEQIVIYNYPKILCNMVVNYPPFVSGKLYVTRLSTSHYMRDGACNK